MSDLAQLDELSAALAREMGRVDVLFANAGIGAMVPFEAQYRPKPDALA
jgi:NAD(P)-dependent dehydrogenase (short-subunit alcohol dehydrogenase family)